jgi:hypothetical protein
MGSVLLESFKPQTIGDQWMSVYDERSHCNTFMAFAQQLPRTKRSNIKAHHRLHMWRAPLPLPRNTKQLNHTKMWNCDQKAAVNIAILFVSQTIAKEFHDFP